jgi:hypothetical protein
VRKTRLIGNEASCRPILRGSVVQPTVDVYTPRGRVCRAYTCGGAGGCAGPTPSGRVGRCHRDVRATEHIYTRDVHARACRASEVCRSRCHERPRPVRPLHILHPLHPLCERSERVLCAGRPLVSPGRMREGGCAGCAGGAGSHNLRLQLPPGRVALYTPPHTPHDHTSPILPTTLPPFGQIFLVGPVPCGPGPCVLAQPCWLSLLRAQASKPAWLASSISACVGSSSHSRALSMEWYSLSFGPSALWRVTTTKA